jgi:hypothetical protein
MDDRAKKIAEFKEEIAILRSRKNLYSSQISSGQFSDEELSEKQEILNKIVFVLDYLCEELRKLEQA